MNQRLSDGKKEAENMKDTLRKVFDMFDEFKNIHNKKERIDIVNNIACPNCNHGQGYP